MRIQGTIILAGLLVMAAFAGSDMPPRLNELGGYHRPVTTVSAEAQRWIDQGLVYAFGFNHDAANGSFERAAALDPDCAFAWWGVALCLGPHINNPVMSQEQSRRAYEAIQRATALAGRSSPVERDLIMALAKRYAWPAPEDRKQLDESYAEAMRGLWRKYPQDADIGTLCAEAIMDLRPWDLWTPDGKPQPGTVELVNLIERVLQLQPRPPGALHLHIHAVEASPDPGRAKASADRLRDLVPEIGHLVHMPSHIDIRLGYYEKAMQANRKAIAADRKYVAQAGREGFLNLYRAHDYHFLAYAAMFAGNRAAALQAATDLKDDLLPAQVRQNPDMLESFLSTMTHVRVRFGMWEELLKDPAPPEDFYVSKAIWRYGRAVARSAHGRIEAPNQERDAFIVAAAAIPETRMIGNNKAATIMEIARPMMEGEFEYRRGNYDLAFAQLRLAVERDDALRYDEPWGWMQPIRHALGALLLEQGRMAEAEAVYRKDLELHPENGWALHGLAECLRKSGKTDEMAEVERRFRKSWQNADIELRASCFCRRNAQAARY